MKNNLSIILLLLVAIIPFTLAADVSKPIDDSQPKDGQDDVGFFTYIWNKLTSVWEKSYTYFFPKDETKPRDVDTKGKMSVVENPEESLILLSKDDNYKLEVKETTDRKGEVTKQICFNLNDKGTEETLKNLEISGEIKTIEKVLNEKGEVAYCYTPLVDEREFKLDNLQTKYEREKVINFVTDNSNISHELFWDVYSDGSLLVKVNNISITKNGDTYKYSWFNSYSTGLDKYVLVRNGGLDLVKIDNKFYEHSYDDICLQVNSNCNLNKINSSYEELTFYSLPFIDPTYFVNYTFPYDMISEGLQTEPNNVSRLNLSQSGMFGNTLLYYSFDADNGTRAYDLGNNSQDATQYGGVVWNTTNGKYDDGVFFDGVNDYLEASDSPLLEPRKNVTWSIWINPQGPGTNSDEAYVFMKARRSGVPYTHWAMGYMNTSSYAGGTDATNKKVFLYYYNTSATGPITSANVTFKEWNMVTFVKNDRNLSVYINGVLFNYTDIVGDIVYNAEPSETLTVGAANFGAGYDRRFNGFIDEFIVINQSMSASEVNALYNNQSARFIVNGNQTRKQTTDELFNAINWTAYFENNLNTKVDGRLFAWNYSMGYNESLNDGLIFYTHMDGNVNDATGNFETNLTGGNLNAQGIWNTSVDLNTSYVVNLTNSSSMTLNNSITAFAWVKAYPNASATARWIFTKRINNSGYASFYFSMTSPGALTLIIVNETGSAQTLTGANQYNLLDNQWHHVGFRTNGTRVSIYFDGREIVASNQLAGNILFPSYDAEIQIGGTDGATSSRWNGTIDEVMLYNRSISDAQIKELYMRGRANYQQVSEYRPLTSGQNQTFLFRLNANYSNFYPEIRLKANTSQGNQSFYTPYLFGNSTFDTFFLENPNLPVFFNFSTSPNSPHEYNPNTLYTFNVSVNDTNGTVYMNFDGTRYLLTNLGSYYSTTLNPLGANTYQYYFYSYNTLGEVTYNQTSNFTYQVTQNTSWNVTNNLTITLDPSSTVTYPIVTTATGLHCLAELTCTLFRDNTAVSNPDSLLLTAATYQYVYNSTSNQNYSVGSAFATLTVNSGGGGGNGTTIIGNLCRVNRPLFDDLRINIIRRPYYC